MIQYKLIIEQNKIFLYTLDTKLKKILRVNNDNIVKESMLRNIREFLIGQNNNFETTQSLIRWKYTFRGYIIKKWINQQI